MYSVNMRVPTYGKKRVMSRRRNSDVIGGPSVVSSSWLTQRLPHDIICTFASMQLINSLKRRIFHASN